MFYDHLALSFGYSQEQILNRQGNDIIQPAIPWSSKKRYSPDCRAYHVHGIEIPSFGFDGVQVTQGRTGAGTLATTRQ